MILADTIKDLVLKPILLSVLNERELNSGKKRMIPANYLQSLEILKAEIKIYLYREMTFFQKFQKY